MIPSWLAIGSITIGLAFVSNRLISSRGATWFRRMQRPSWLTFEPAIPLIWITVFICGAWSAVVVWEARPGQPQTWGWMAFYLVVELVTLSYTPAMLALRRLQVGTFIGGTGFLLAALLALSIWQISSWATLLLLPYLLWSPIGTYVTWEMSRLNPADA